MIFRIIGSGIALASGLAFAAAPAVAACSHPDCRAAFASAPSKPLQLNAFMRRPSPPAVRAAKTWRNGTVAAAAPIRKRRPVAAPAEPADLPADPAQAMALHTAPLVRVVTSDELNEIDLAANAETVGRAPAAHTDASAARPAQTIAFNDIDRIAGALRVATAEVPARDEALRPERLAAKPAQAGEGWAVRVWNMLHAGFSALAGAVLWFFR